jgi:hypothetical protein
MTAVVGCGSIGRRAETSRNSGLRNMPYFQKLFRRWWTVRDGNLAEREGFEPPIRLPVCRISSAVHSTTLPPLRPIVIYHEIDHGRAEFPPPGPDSCDCRNVQARNFSARRYSAPKDGVESWLPQRCLDPRAGLGMRPADPEMKATIRLPLLPRSRRTRLRPPSAGKPQAIRHRKAAARGAARRSNRCVVVRRCARRSP